MPIGASDGASVGPCVGNGVGIRVGGGEMTIPIGASDGASVGPCVGHGVGIRVAPGEGPSPVIGFSASFVAVSPERRELTPLLSLMKVVLPSSRAISSVTPSRRIISPSPLVPGNPARG